MTTPRSHEQDLDPIAHTPAQADKLAEAHGLVADTIQKDALGLAGRTPEPSLAPQPPPVEEARKTEPPETPGRIR